MNETTYMLIQVHLSFAVPLLIAKIKARGGPSKADCERMQENAFYLAEHGDAILYKEKRTSAEAMNKMAEGIAILAFCPGGIKCFGLEFEVQ